MSTASTKAGERYPDPKQMISVEAPGMGYKREGYQTCYAEEVKPRDATIAELRSEVEEQARLLGVGASREAALMAEVERWKKVAQVACDALDCASKEAFYTEENHINEVDNALSLLAENGITPSK